MEITDQRDLDDIKNFYAVSMILFTLINRVIDLGDEIVTSRNLGVPGTAGGYSIFLSEESGNR